MRKPSLSQTAILAGALALTAIGGYYGYQRFGPRPVAAARVTTQEVAQGNIVSTVSATGSVASPATSKLSFTTGGRLIELLVGVGTPVQEGQPLARIDTRDLEVALAQARAGYKSAVANLEKTRQGATAEDIRAAQAQVDSARIKLEQARAVPTGPDVVAARAQVESARIKLEQTLAGARPEDVGAAQAQLDAAQAKLAALLNPRPEDLAAAQSQLESARIKLEQLRNPRAEDVRSAEAALASARVKLAALLNPRPEDLASAQSQLDQAKTKLAQLVDQPRTAKPEDIANAELSVSNAQVAYDKALADAGLVGKSGGPSNQAAADAAVKQALIGLQTAQNNLTKLQQQGPTDWEIRLAQQAVDAAQSALEKLQRPAPADVQAAQASVEQAQATLDKLMTPSDYEVQAAQESVKQAQISLDKLTSPSPADVAAAQQAVVAAQANLDTLVRPNEYDVQAAQQSLVQAQANLDKLLTSNRYEVATAQTSLTQQLANLDLKRLPATQQDLVVATASVEQAQAQLQQAEANLAAATLTAPFSGVVSALGANLGEQVGAGTAAVTLVDTRQARVDVVVDETDVAKIQPGQQVNLTFEALPGQSMPGTVSVIAPVGTTTNGVVTYPVQIQVDPAQAQRAGIRPGMTATASIVTTSKQNVLVVPNRALRTQGRTRTVEVLNAEGKTEQRQVQVGVANDQSTEVLSGLQPGEQVVIPTTTTAAARVAVPGVAGIGGAGGPPGGFVGGRR